MKHLNPILLLLPLLAGTLVFQSCSVDDLLPDGGATSPGDLPTLTVSVKDGGYTLVGAPQGASPSTRTNDLGYVTEFTVGDRIGVYAVTNGAVVSEINNLCLTAADRGDGTGMLKWDIPAGTTLPSDATYYAYYPWQSSLNGAVNPAVSTDTEFFANAISAWSPAIDQGTHEKYTQQDLMTAKGSVSGTGLEFGLKHQMALVAIDLPKVTYKFTNTDQALEDYTVDAPDAQFTGFSPYRMNVGYYGYLISPSSAAPALEGSYSYLASGSTATYSLVVSGIEAGHAKKFVIDGGSAAATVVSHLLQTGDFFMKGGTLISKDETLTAAQQANCIGVVIKVGRETTGTWADNSDYYKKGSTKEKMPTVRGYVLARDVANGGASCAWGAKGTVIGTDMTQFTLFVGYSNTKKIKDYADANGLTLQTAFPATYYATYDYETREGGRYASPSNTSGWFLPSAGQCQYWLNQRDELMGNLGALVKAGGKGTWKDDYWSSSEYTSFDLGSSFACTLSSPNAGNRIYYRQKDELSRVQPFLAF